MSGRRGAIARSMPRGDSGEAGQPLTSPVPRAIFGNTWRRSNGLPPIISESHSLASHGSNVRYRELSRHPEPFSRKVGRKLGCRLVTTKATIASLLFAWIAWTAGVVVMLPTPRKRNQPNPECRFGGFRCLATSHRGAGGNRTPVHQPVDEPATTVPGFEAYAAPPAGRLVTSRSPTPGLSLEPAVFPAVSGLSHRHPPLLLPGCGGPAPCGIAAHDDSSPT